MKRTKSNLLVVATLAGLMACGPIARGQDNGAPPPPPPPAAPGGDNGAPPPPRPGRGGAGGMQQAIQAALDKLDLTADEKEKVGPVLKTMRDKMMAMRSDTTLSNEDRRAKGKEIMDAVDASLKDILTADQYAKWQEARKNLRPGGRQPRPGGPPPPDAPKPPADPSKN